MKDMVSRVVQDQDIVVVLCSNGRCATLNLGKVLRYTDKSITYETLAPGRKSYGYEPEVGKIQQCQVSHKFLIHSRNDKLIG